MATGLRWIVWPPGSFDLLNLQIKISPEATQAHLAVLWAQCLHEYQCKAFRNYIYYNYNGWLLMNKGRLDVRIQTTCHERLVPKATD